jgi:beta-galactosidase
MLGRRQSSRRFLISAISIFLLFLFSQCETEEDKVRTHTLFDSKWSFYRGELEGGEQVTLDDTSWRLLSLPHDWSIENIPGTNSPLDPEAIGEVSAGFFVGGTGWYRKHFVIDSSEDKRKILLHFEGVYMNADVWLNGEHLGNHPYGYTGFGYDISDKIKFNEDNVLAVEVKNEGQNSRWYSGSGIYRHLWLIATNLVHIPEWGVYITTPEVSEREAIVNFKIEVTNDSENSADLKVLTRILNEVEISSMEDTIKLEPGVSGAVSQNLVVQNPELWSPENPNLYKALIEVFDGSTLIDRTERTFGIRTIEYSVENGFLLNGKPILLKGGNMHHGNGPLGAAAYDRAEERRVELMKASGFNTIRCAHNPPSEAFLDACDRLGMMVIDEAFDMWRRPKNPEDYSNYFDEWWQKDVEAMVKRDWNHPSIIMWSSGNEIPERGEPEGVETSKMISSFIKDLDPTRPVTAAVNGLNPDKDPYFGTLGVSGYNYAVGGDHGKESIYAIDHKRVPDRIMYGAESYPLEAFGSWMDVVDYPYVIGDFVWTGFDYLGEASIGWRGYMQEKDFYPWSHAYCGDIDICGFKRPQSYYRDVLWDNADKPLIFVHPPEPSFELNPRRMDWSKWHWEDVVTSWNWEGFEGQKLTVDIYNSSESVELFLNETSLGKRATNRENEWIASWEIPFEPGTLKAVSYGGDQIVGESSLSTAGKVETIRLTSDRPEIKANEQDLCYITVELLDENGIRNPKAENEISYKIEGPGEILAVASSNPMSTESYQQMSRKVWRGRGLVIIKALSIPGEIVLFAQAEGLPPSETRIVSRSEIGGSP